MDIITVQCVSILCAVALLIIISWIIISCCCSGVPYPYSQGYISTIDEELPAIRMSEFTGYSNRNLSTIDEETWTGTDQGGE